MPYITNIPRTADTATDITEFAVSQGAAASDQKKITWATIKSVLATAFKHGGSNEIATATAAANAIPKAGAGSTLAKEWLPTATTSAQGAVTLASTGVESETKVPKATGADLAALLTAGGYTLTAPSGANSLDGIADTATWKKVAAAVATALNAGNLVSQYNISDLHTITGECWFNTAEKPSNRPSSSGFYFGFQRYFALNPDFKEVVVWEVATGIQYRDVMQGGVWQGWKTIWDSGNDGNGGQPPAPKPRAATDSDIGQFVKKFVTAGNALSAPAGGTWAFFVLHMNSDGTIYNDNSGVVSGGSVVLSAVSGKIPFGFFWRIA